MCRIERVFHPVGQGAFYSEHFYVSQRKYKVVYDCGTSSLSEQKKAVVRQSFSKEETIDILFISHLDWDHISLIPTLVSSVKRIRHVVLPHVGDEHLILLSLTTLSKTSKVNLNEVLEILRSPEEYFREAQIWRIRQAEENEQIEEYRGEPVFLDDEQEPKGPLPSGKRLSLTGIGFWCYIPFNYYSRTEFQEILKKELRDNTDFQENFKKLLGEKSNRVSVDEVLDTLKDPEKLDDIIKNVPVRKKLKEIYNQLEGKINAHSLVLYSGPTINYSTPQFLFPQITAGCSPLYGRYYHRYLLELCFNFEDICYDLRYRIACIYNGDSNYNEHKLKDWLPGLWCNVGTIQVAHHGSKISHDFDYSKDHCFLCPISYDTGNTYGHPSSEVLRDLVVKNRIPICITEDLGSEFIQIISLW